MKSLKTYNMDRESIEILNRKRNKSQFVNRAVKRLQAQQRSFSLSDVSTKMMLNSLLTREDLSKQLKKMIELELWE